MANILWHKQGWQPRIHFDLFHVTHAELYYEKLYYMVGKVGYKSNYTPGTFSFHQTTWLFHNQINMVQQKKPTVAIIGGG